MIKEIHNGAMKTANAMPASPRPADFVSRRTKITSIHEHAKKMPPYPCFPVSSLNAGCRCDDACFISFVPLLNSRTGRLRSLVLLLHRLVVPRVHLILQRCSIVNLSLLNLFPRRCEHRVWKTHRFEERDGWPS